MKTSLVIDDSLFRSAQKEALKNRKTISETISQWARIGRDIVRKARKEAPKTFKSVDLGGPSLVDLNSRRDWMDSIDY